MPQSPPGGANASPERFTRTRRYDARGSRPAPAASAGAAVGPAAPPVAASRPTPSPPSANASHESANPHVLPDRGPELRHHVLDARLPFHVPEEGLVEEAPLLVERLELALHDPRYHLLGLALLAGLGLV